MITFTQIAKNKGFKKVELKLERHPVYASNVNSTFKVTTVKAYKDVSEDRVHYYWNQNTIGSRRHESEWVGTDKARYLLLNEREL